MGIKCLAAIGNVCYSEASKEYKDTLELRDQILSAVFKESQKGNTPSDYPPPSAFEVGALRVIDDMMEKFYVWNECEFKDVTEELERSYENDFACNLRTTDGFMLTAKTNTEYCFRGFEFIIGSDGVVREITDTNVYKRTHKAKTIKVINKTPIKKVYPYIRDYADYMGFEYDEENDIFGYWHNPYGVYECYVVGSYHFPISEDCEYYISPLKISPTKFIEYGGKRYRLVAGARKKDIDFKVLESIAPIMGYSFAYILPSESIAKRTELDVYMRNPAINEVKSFIDKLNDNDIITVIDVDRSI